MDVFRHEDLGTNGRPFGNPDYSGSFPPFPFPCGVQGGNDRSLRLVVSSLHANGVADLGPVLGTETLEFTGVLVSDVKSHTRISLGKRSERGDLFS